MLLFGVVLNRDKGRDIYSYFLRAKKDILADCNLQCMQSKFYFVPQPDAMDCGAACLAMISRYYGKYRPVSKLREMCHATREGVSLLDLSNAAEQL